eukprot:TRINITY_DN5236_c0_g1_i1.p1 TRINITY_DN5236_c0_g1~~TRINITY_DN5236_c0_g1_i1.p1  ORF type:complete len:560 (-),score=152.76 TRINITY_DN5236_c0_g1_i1:210-1865(-)
MRNASQCEKCHEARNAEAILACGIRIGCLQVFKIYIQNFATNFRSFLKFSVFFHFFRLSVSCIITAGDAAVDTPTSTPLISLSTCESSLMDAILFVLGSVLCCVLVAALFSRSAKHAADGVPEVPLLSLLGSFTDFVGFLDKVHKQYGDVVSIRVPFYRRVYLVLGEGGCKFFHSSKELSIEGGYDALIGGFTPEKRLGVPPYISMPNMVARRFSAARYDRFAEMMQESAERLVASLGPSGTFDLFDVIHSHLLSFNTWCFTGLTKGPDHDEWIRLFRLGDPETSSRDFLLMMQRMLPGFKEKRQQLYMDHKKILDKVVQERAASGVEEADVLTDIIDFCTSPETGEVDHTGVYIVAWEAMLAGTLTTFATLSWLILQLIQHQDVRERVLKEFADAKLAAGGKAGFQELSSMQYYERVIKETLRLCVTGISARESTAEVAYGSVRIPEKSLLVFAHKIYNTEMYDRPDEFWPDRWLEEQARARPSIGFGAGRHPCPGARFASQFMKITAATLLDTFNLKLETAVELEPRQVIGMKKPTKPVIVSYSRKNAA